VIRLEKGVQVGEAIDLGASGQREGQKVGRKLEDGFGVSEEFARHAPRFARPCREESQRQL